MAYELEKSTGDIVINGFEQGIAPSPHKGIANIQNANISTETGEVINSFLRVQDTMTSTATGTGTLTFVDSSHVSLSITGSNNLFKGNWITVSSSSNTSQLPNGTYYVPPSTGANFQLQQYYNSLTYTLPVTVNYTLVGGGGGGGGSTGSTGGGGGGEGGQVQAGTTSIGAGTYPVVLGTGGAAGTGGGPATGGTGVSTTALSVTALGGVGGGSGSGTPGTGGTGNGGANGGNGGNNAGAGSVGTDGTSNSISGTAVKYGPGGGGGGGQTNGVQGLGGATGGGNGGNGGVSATAGSSGSANTGGGGGGGGAKSGSDLNGGAGGSGIVVISYPTGSIIGATGGTITFITVGTTGMTIHTFTASANFVVPTPTVLAQPLTGFTTGLTATIRLVATMGKPTASATEAYFSSGISYNRYYILDSNGLVWVYDSQNEISFSSSDNVNWFLPDYNTLTNASGIAVVSGTLVVSTPLGLYGKSVAVLGSTNSQSTNFVIFFDVQGWKGSANGIGIPHFCYTGFTDSLYVTDASYIVGIFPDSAVANPGISTSQNIQTFCSWNVTINADTGTYSIISGTTPTSDDGKRVPVVFSTTGTLPASITNGTVYYLDGINAAGYPNFQVYAAATGGTQLDLVAGTTGIQYFNTFYPFAQAPSSAGATPTYVLTNPVMALPIFEVAQCMTEIGTDIIIGCKSSTVYPWDQKSTQASNIISLPELNVTSIITVHQIAYIFAGSKGNIYLTDGSVASLVTSIPDYCAGVPGTPSSYIEPIFSWQGTMYLRGRVYFSILDQTATKVGNCGGIWSFVPTQNFYIGQDIGIGMRLENQNSYGTYNGAATVLIPKQNQNVISPQYFSGWESTVSSPAYGIDATGTTFSPTAIVESDAIPTGTMLDKKSFSQIEFKLSSPLLANDTVTLFYRKNLTASWQSLGTVQLQGDRLSGYVSANFEKSQWLQIRTLLNASSSFIRLTEERIR